MDEWNIILSKYNGNATVLDIPGEAVIEGGTYRTKLYTDCSGFFENKKSLTSVDLSKVDTSGLTDVSSMFSGCSGLTSLNLSGFNTPEVLNMGSMFKGCSGLTSLDLSGFYTSKAVNMNSMFSGCSGLTSLEIRNFDTGNVTDMGNMFYGCSSLTELNLGSFDTGNVTAMYSMFNRCGNLTSLDLSGFNMNSVTNGSDMFYGDALVMIDIPLNVHGNIALPGTFVKRAATGTETGTEFTFLPVNETSSYTIVKKEAYVPVSGISIKPASKTLAVNETFTISARIIPENATDKGITWISNDTQTATVGSDGTVTGLKEGTALITAKSSDGGFEKTCRVNVRTREESVPVEDISIPNKYKYVGTGGSFRVTPIIIPDDASDQTVIWSSSDDTVASVDETGLITAHGVGEATIWARTRDGGREAKFIVRVVANKTDVTGIRLESSSKKLRPGEVFTIVPIIIPGNATDQTVLWKSENPDVAIVDENGQVRGIASGTTTITAITNDGDLIADIVITVDADPSVRHVEDITLPNEYKIFKEGESFRVTPTIIPAGATDQTVIWSSDDETIASVDDTGLITTHKGGSTIIRARTRDGGKEAILIVRVVRDKTDVTGITFVSDRESIKSGDDYYIIAVIAPEDATDKLIIWTSSDPKVAIVDEDGRVTGLSPGTAVITARTNDGDLTRDFYITVEPVTAKSIELDKYYIELFIGDDEQITATVKPDNATDKRVRFKSKDGTVADVDANGNIIAIAPGTTTITVITENGIEEECTVAVNSRKVPVKKITLSPDSKTLCIGESVDITAIIDPENATDQRVTWTSEDTAVAVVNGGRVIAKSPGTVRIKATVRTDDGVKEAVCVIVVLERPVEVESITFDTTEEKIFVKQNLPLKVTILPDDATDKSVRWTTNNSKVATVDDKGNVIGVSVGEAIITATASNGMNAICHIVVEKMPVRVKYLYLSHVIKTIYVGEAFNIWAVVLPADADVKSVAWISSRPDITSVDNNGRVLGRSTGEAIITAITVDGGITAQCKVTVTDKPDPGTSYKLYIVDKRNNYAPNKDKVRASVDILKADRYLIITDSDGSRLKLLINGDGSLGYNMVVFYNLRLTDSSGNDVYDFGKCTIRIPLSPYMDIGKGTVRVVGLLDNKPDKSIPSSTGYEDGIPYVTFTTGYFSEFAILYRSDPSAGYYNQNYNSSPYLYVPTNNNNRILDSIPRTGYGPCLQIITGRHEGRDM